MLGGKQAGLLEGMGAHHGSRGGRDHADTRRASPYTGEGRHDPVDVSPNASRSIRSVREGVPSVVAHWHGAGREAHPTGYRSWAVHTLHTRLPHARRSLNTARLIPGEEGTPHAA